MTRTDPGPASQTTGPASDAPVVDVAEFIDGRPIGGFQKRVYLAGFLITLLDGLDVLSMSLAAPWLAQAWELAPSSFGPVFGAGPAGMAMGALFLGPRRITSAANG